MANPREILKSKNGFGLKELHEKLRLSDEYEEWFKNIGKITPRKRIFEQNF